MEELKILSDTYTAEKVEVHRLIRWELPKAWYGSSTHPALSRLIHFCAFPFLCIFWGARSFYCISCAWVLRDRLEGAIRLQEQDMEKSRQVLNTYEVLGEEFDKLVKEYTQLKQATENKRWTLQEFNKACRWGWVGPGGLASAEEPSACLPVERTTSTRGHLHSRACGDPCPKHYPKLCPKQSPLGTLLVFLPCL